MTDKVFALVIIDEWAQATEPDTLIPLQWAKKVILAGDHKQLEPVVNSKKAARMGLNITLFEKIKYRFPEVSKMLNIQHRMNKDIMKWSSETMYNGQLIAAPEVKHHWLGFPPLYQIPEGSDDDDYRLFLYNSLVYIDSNTGKEEEQKDPRTKSFYNMSEVKLVSVIVNKLRKLGVKDTDIGIITPYKTQSNRIKIQLHDQTFENDEPHLEIKTVDGFQGREKEVIIISMVRSNEKGNVGFLGNKRRMNVAITRARKLCILIGDSLTTDDSSYQNYTSKYQDEDEDEEYYDIEPDISHLKKPIKIPKTWTFYSDSISYLANLYNYFKRFGTTRTIQDYHYELKELAEVNTHFIPLTIYQNNFQKSTYSKAPKKMRDDFGHSVLKKWSRVFKPKSQNFGKFKKPATQHTIESVLIDIIKSKKSKI